MAEKLAPELWINIFQHLTPVDLCFSVSPVNKLFYELSQENQIWSQFKCANWNENSSSLLPPTIKRKYPVSEQSTESLYKLLYVNWIREQGRAARKAKKIPEWFFTVEGKRNIVIGVCGDTHRYGTEYDFEDQHFLTKGKPAPEGVESDDISHYFTDKTFNAQLMAWDLFGSRVSMERLVVRRIGSDVLGTFWCMDTFTAQGKTYINTVKSRLQAVSPVAHLVIVDYSSLSSKKTPMPEEFKEWVRSENLELVEFKDIDSAMDNMAKTVTTKFKAAIPKYLPTELEFKKYVGEYKKA